MFLAIITVARTSDVLYVALSERRFTEATRNRSRCKRLNNGISRQCNRISSSNRLRLSQRPSNLYHLRHRDNRESPLQQLSLLSLPTSDGRPAPECLRLFRCLVSVSILQFNDRWFNLVKLVLVRLPNVSMSTPDTFTTIKHQLRANLLFPVCQGLLTRMVRSLCPSTQAPSHARITL